MLWFLGRLALCKVDVQLVVLVNLEGGRFGLCFFLAFFRLFSLQELVEALAVVLFEVL